jgi:hypothetical protein
VRFSVVFLLHTPTPTPTPYSAVFLLHAPTLAPIKIGCGLVRCGSCGLVGCVGEAYTPRFNLLSCYDLVVLIVILALYCF